MSRKNKKKKAVKAMLKASARIAGIDRAEHFKNGGTPNMWNPPRKVHTSKRDKRRSRKSDRNNAIKDSRSDNDDD